MVAFKNIHNYRSDVEKKISCIDARKCLYEHDRIRKKNICKWNMQKKFGNIPKKNNFNPLSHKQNLTIRKRMILKLQYLIEI